MSYLKSRGFRPAKNEPEEKNIAEKDAFQEQGQRLIDRLASHPYFIIGTVAAVIVTVVVAILVADKVAESRSAKARSFVDAMALWEGKNADGSAAKDEPARLKEALAKFAEAEKTLQGSFMGDTAAFYQAKIHYRLKEFDSAIKIFQRLQDSSKIPPEIRFGAYEGEAYCHLDRDDATSAVAVWERYYALKNASLYRDFALYYIGTAYEKMNDAAKAVEYFKRLKAEYPESPLVSKVADRLPEDRQPS